ncbi:MAG: hypothetical protein LC116_05875 [Bacteroidetes bacterium]|nr:hypothetical protein [Bacteroidota bacterium]MCZ2132706.1 hypothetical protein [Bacteroidota bacterium]
MLQSTTFLTIQSTAAIISLIATALVISVVVFLMTTSSVDEDKTSAKNKVYKIRGRYMIGLISCVVISLLFTLRLLPYPQFHDKPDRTITVVAMQWAWKMTDGEPNVKPDMLEGTPDISVPVNKQIQFVVTSQDVNHNFAIYDAKGVLLAQTQAMPEYKNRLNYTFAEKGDYHVFCLEYCGLLHAGMFATIHVE